MINTDLLSDITVVIRSSGEATLRSLINQVSLEVDSKDIFVIEEVPFSKAVEKTFKIGIERDKKWTLALDADLLLLPQAIEKISRSASKYPEDLYVYQGNILDWFRGGIKFGGPHLYKTSNLQIALSFLELNIDSLRPESSIYKLMKDEGYQVALENKLFSVHDFFQSYEDIYRKAFFHGVKHPAYVSLIPQWMKNSIDQIEFEIVVKGFVEGFYDSLGSYPSIDDLQKKFRESFSFKEISPKDIKSQDVMNILNQAKLKLNDKYEIQKKPKKNVVSKIKSGIKSIRR